MLKKTIFILVIPIVLGLGAYFFFASETESQDALEQEYFEPLRELENSMDRVSWTGAQKESFARDCQNDFLSDLMDSDGTPEELSQKYAESFCECFQERLEEQAVLSEAELQNLESLNLQSPGIAQYMNSEMGGISSDFCYEVAEKVFEEAGY